MPVQIKQPQFGVVHRRITFSDAGLSAGVLIGRVPIGSTIYSCRTIVRTAFDAGTTNYWRVGFGGGGFEYSGIDINIGVAGTIDHVNALELGTLGAPRDVTARYVGSGTAPTKGVLYFTMEYGFGGYVG